MSKFVISGKTYNTETATAAASYEFENDKGNTEGAVIYRTRAGLFFVVYDELTGYDDEDGSPMYRRYAETLTHAELEHVKTSGHVLTVLNDAALEPPDEEGSDEATLYVRLPGHEKEAITKAAAKRQMSVNAWVCSALVRAAGEDLKPVTIKERLLKRQPDYTNMSPDEQLKASAAAAVAMSVTASK
jgi:uncharacterized protein (DUF1778 family)